MRFSSKQGGIKIQSCSGDKNSFTPNPCNICKDSDPALVLFHFEDHDCEVFSWGMQRLVIIIHIFTKENLDLSYLSYVLFLAKGSRL